jgi:hypothetical protein
VLIEHRPDDVELCEGVAGLLILVSEINRFYIAFGALSASVRLHLNNDRCMYDMHNHCRLWRITMKPTDEVYREACLRHHRTLAHYFAVYAWKKCIDCIALERRELEHFLNVQRFGDRRMAWFRADVEPWFPFMRHLCEAGTSEKLAIVYLSRVEFPEDGMRGTATTSQRNAALNAAGLRAAVYSAGSPSERRALSEKQIISSMSLIASGLVSINDVPGL